MKRILSYINRKFFSFSKIFDMFRTFNSTEKNTLIEPIHLIDKYLSHRNLRSTFLVTTKFNKKPRKNRLLFFPNKRKLNLELLNVFYILTLCGNITLASEKLAISQPAINLCINKLEKETGTLLFQQLNSKKLLKLTSSGLILFNYIQRLFQLIQESLDVSTSIFLNSFNYNVKSKVYSNLKFYYKSFLNKKTYYPNIKFLTFDNFSGSLKHLATLKLDDFEYFETTSKILLYKKRFNYAQPLNLPLTILKKKVNFEFIKLDKLNPIQFLNNDVDDSLKSVSFIEIQTCKAFNACLELELSTFIYWGSEF